MTRKAPTLSEKAYNALDRAKGKNKSPIKVIRRPTGKRAKVDLLEYVRSTSPNNQLADSIEKVLKKRNRIHLRTARVNVVRKREMIKAAESIDRLRESSTTSGWTGAREIRKWRDNIAKVSRWKTTVTSKGQIRIPVELRKKYGIRKGTMIEVLDHPAGLMLRPIPGMEGSSSRQLYRI
jgi:AbrB family looped-hinge helix DNA binding protein